MAICFSLLFASLINEKAGTLAYYLAGGMESTSYLLFITIYSGCLSTSRSDKKSLVFFLLFTVITLIGVAFIHVHFKATWANMIGFFIPGGIYLITSCFMFCFR